MKQYRDGLMDVLINGRTREDRTGVGRHSVFGRMDRYDLNAGFPLVGDKFTSFHNIKHELLWMLSGSTRLKYLKENRVSIWDEWVKPSTAIICPCTVDQVIVKIKRDEKLGVSELTTMLKVVEDWLEDRGVIAFYSIHLEDVAPEGRRLIKVSRPTGDVRIDTIEKLGGLLWLVVRDFRDQLGQISRLANIGDDDKLLPWQKEVLKQGTWVEGCIPTKDWPFEILDGELGPVYGKQMTAWQPGIDPQELIDTLKFEGEDEGHGKVIHMDSLNNLINKLTPKPINQIQAIIDQLINNPTSSRMILNLWNVGELHLMALPPCHMVSQFFSEEMTIDERHSWGMCNIEGYKESLCQVVSGEEPELDVFMDLQGVPKRRLSCMLFQRKSYCAPVV